mgnify:FL=1
MSDQSPEINAAEAQLAQAFQQFLIEQAKTTDARVEAKPDEGGDDVKFVKTGWIRVTIGETELHLRAAFFGEVKTLLTLLENHQDALTTHRHMVKREDAKLQARLVEVDAMEEDEEKWSAQAKLAIDLRNNSRSIRDKADELRISWWTKVFELLNIERTGETEKSKGAVPRQWPGWVADADLPTKCVEHWRAVPLGRG